MNNDEMKYLLLKEIEKQYGSEILKEPGSLWNVDDEQEFQKSIVTLKQKKNNESVREAKKKVPSCSSCGLSFSPDYDNQIYIKKFGVCLGCYTKPHN